MFYLGGVALAFFLCLLLLSKGNKTLADKILSLWLLVITLHLLLFYFTKSMLYPQLLGLGIPLPLVHGPFLYLYTMALTNRGLALWTALFHFVPSLADLIYISPFLALPTEQKIYIFQHHGEGYETFNLVNIILIIASGIFYVTLSGLALRKHRLSIVNEFSSTEKINLDWLKYLIYWIGGIWVLVIIGNDDLVFGAVVLFILFIGFFGIRQVGVFHSAGFKSPGITGVESIAGEEDTGNNNAEGFPERRKYLKSGLNIDSSESLRRSLSEMMITEKPFRESELSLADLAMRLNAKPNHLSQVINELEGKNFYDYINSLRIGEFMRLAASSESRKYTLLGLAQECGFSSKSSFNRYFKKVTGKSPSEYLQTIPESVN